MVLLPEELRPEDGWQDSCVLPTEELPHAGIEQKNSFSVNKKTLPVTLPIRITYLAVMCLLHRGLVEARGHNL